MGTGAAEPGDIKSSHPCQLACTDSVFCMEKRTMQLTVGSGLNPQLQLHHRFSLGGFEGRITERNSGYVQIKILPLKELPTLLASHMMLTYI